MWFLALPPRGEIDYLLCALPWRGHAHTDPSEVPLPPPQPPAPALGTGGSRTGGQGDLWEGRAPAAPPSPPCSQLAPDLPARCHHPSPQSWAVQRDPTAAPPSPAPCAAEPDAALCLPGSGSGAIINFDLIGGNVAAEPSWPQHSYLLGSSQSPAKAAASPSWAACSRLVCVPRLRGDAG